MRRYLAAAMLAMLALGAAPSAAQAQARPRTRVIETNGTVVSAHYRPQRLTIDTGPELYLRGIHWTRYTSTRATGTGWLVSCDMHCAHYGRKSFTLSGTRGFSTWGPVFTRLRIEGRCRYYITTWHWHGGRYPAYSPGQCH